jgi:hypothetical protein
VVGAAGVAVEFGKPDHLTGIKVGAGMPALSEGERCRSLLSATCKHACWGERARCARPAGVNYTMMFCRLFSRDRCGHVTNRTQFLLRS